MFFGSMIDETILPCPMLKPEAGQRRNASLHRGTLGATWEPDECLPPQLDRIRLREKKSWIERRKDAEVRMVLEAAKADHDC
jgi:hypothetical protein